MANSITHARSLPIYGAAYTCPVPFWKSDGTDAAPTSLDTEVSLDGGAWADATNEVTLLKETGGSTDSAEGWITFTAAEMTCDLLEVKVKSGNCITAKFSVVPLRITAQRTGTAQAGAASTITLDASASAVDNYYQGMTIRTDSGTGAGQARFIASYVGSTKVATVQRVWETNPSSDTTFTVGIPLCAPSSAPGSQAALDAQGYSSTRAGYIDAAVSTRSTYAGGAVASVTGDVGGKIIGGGASTITGIGAWVAGASGSAVALASKLLSYVQSLARSNATVDPDIGGTYDPATDAQQALADTLATVVPGQEPTGFPVTVTVTCGGVAVLDACVTLQTAGGSTTYCTNASGVVDDFVRPAGSYALTIPGTGSYQDYSGTVTVGNTGAVTGNTVALTSIALPTPASADCLALWDTETDEQDAHFGAAGMTVTIVDLSAAGRVDATNNRFRSVMGRSATTDANGQWSLDIPSAAFDAGAYLTLRKTWTDAAGDAQSEDWTAELAAPVSGSQVCWSDLDPAQV